MNRSPATSPEREPRPPSAARGASRGRSARPSRTTSTRAAGCRSGTTAQPEPFDSLRAAIAGRSSRVALVLLLAAPAFGAEPADDALFETRIRPLLVARCGECHGAEKQQGGVRLDRRDGAFAGDHGPLIAPGDSAGSRLIEVLAHDEYDVGMPPEGRLPDDEIALLAAWIDRGAPWPADRPEGENAPDPRDHWAFRPVRRPPAPDVARATPIDRFLNAKLAAAGLDPAPRADRRTQVRRLYLDLLGVPPTWDELRSVLADDSPDWWPRLVDRVLADPRHGPRWARHWLDVARYADTKGYVFREAIEYPFAWTYRDYVVDAFNADKPFDRFVTEQLAADRLGLAPNAPELAAMGFLTLGPRFLNSPVLIADDRVDVVSRGLLGLTVACARCHDHKYDPVPTEDYYALYGVFRSSAEPDELPTIGEPPDTPGARAFAAGRTRLEAEEAAEIAKQTAAIGADLRARFGDHLAAAADVRPDSGGPAGSLRRAAVRRLRVALADASESDPLIGEWVRLRAAPDAADPGAVAALVARFNGAGPDSDDHVRAAADHWANVPPDRFRSYVNTAERNAVRAKTRAVAEYVARSPHAPPRAHVLIDGERRLHNTVFIRGDDRRRGEEVVPHAVPSLLTGGELVELAADPASATGATGRLELAAAIMDPANPLTARVIVNRLWGWHFGGGLVATPSDFGTRADPPSHPDLLDRLAADFVADGWSLKRLHRRIVLTDAYRRAAGPAGGERARLLAHFPRRRLTFEAWRDAALHVSGVLDGTVGGRSADLFAPAAGGSPMTRRTVYGTVNRNDLPGVLRNFDFPDPEASAASRTESAVPQQGLFALNGPELAAWSGALAAGLKPAANDSDGGFVPALYRRVLAREPSPAEIDRAAAFLRAVSEGGAGPDGPAMLAQALLMSNEFAFLE